MCHVVLKFAWGIFFFDFSREELCQ